MAATKAIVDSVLERYFSRKLMVWLTTTGMLFFDKITGDQWIAVSLAYIGAQGLADIATKWKAVK